MNSIDKLREKIELDVNNPWSDLKGDLLALVDKVEREIERGYMKLPVDADGEVINVGDMMERGKVRGRVIALMLSNYPKKWGGALHWGIQLEGEQAPTALDALFNHYHKPTVEDVLRQVIACANNGTHVHGALDTEQIVAEYAAKLRLAGDAE